MLATPGVNSMPHWNGKRAGLLYDAIATYVKSAGEDDSRQQLVHIMRRAKDASTTAATTDIQVNGIHSELCAYCIENKLFNCRGHQFQPECAFMESAFGLRTSQFDRLT
jgi:hypothetical protein